MSWLKLAVSGSDVQFNRGYFSSTVTASIFSGSHQGNGSGLTNILSASYAISASWAPGGQSVTASYALTASYLDNANLYYVHTQSSNDVLWTVNHNLGADYVNVTVWSGSDVVIPQRITRINNNTIHVVFPVSESGYVVTTRGTFTQTSVATSSYALGGSGSFSGNGSGLTNIQSASYSSTSSYFQETKTFGITIDGGGSTITTGIKGDITIPFNCYIDSWYLTADQAGSIVIDVWKDIFANFPPSVADSIAGTEKPTLSSSTFNSDTNLTTWTSRLVSSGDVIRFNVDSVSTVTRVNLVFRAFV